LSYNRYDNTIFGFWFIIAGARSNKVVVDEEKEEEKEEESSFE
jgi:hypothetical protein